MSKSYVYIIARVIDPNADERYGAPVKIGMSSQIWCRLDTLQTAAPFKIEVFQRFEFPDRESAYEVEHAFHRAMKAKQAHGEWFNLTPTEALQQIGIQLYEYMRFKLKIPSHRNRMRCLASMMGGDPDELAGPAE
jgi:hypothetical protein